MPTPIIMPRQGQSVESCILVSWNVKPGDQVEAGSIVAGIETDKATFDVESPAAGTILELFFEEGDDIPVLTNIAAVGNAGEDANTLRPGTVSSTVEELPNPHPSANTTPIQCPDASKSTTPEAPLTNASPPSTGISPRARQAAANAGIDVAHLAGTGPGGRVIERDVRSAAAAGSPLTPHAREVRQTGGLLAPATGSGPGGRILASDLRPAGAPAANTSLATREIPVTGIRKIIAQRMMASLGGTAQLTLTRSFDASAIQRFRKQVKAAGEPFGFSSVSVNDLIVFATARTLLRHPGLNAHFLGDKIIEHGSINLGIAVDTPRGLMVPVLRDAHALTLREVAASIRPLATACQQGNINPDHLAGGTFTITNLGALGVETFTPVLNAPEVAILGVGGITLKPVRTEDGIQYVDAIHLSLTIDHQAIDGAPAARFLQDLCESLENLELLLASGN